MSRLNNTDGKLSEFDIELDEAESGLNYSWFESTHVSKSEFESKLIWVASDRIVSSYYANCDTVYAQIYAQTKNMQYACEYSHHYAMVVSKHGETFANNYAKAYIQGKNKIHFSQLREYAFALALSQNQ